MEIACSVYLASTELAGRPNYSFQSYFSSKLGTLNFCVILNGYIGYRSETQPSDIICILIGCRILVLFRPRDKGYILFGQAFVLGLMNGELLVFCDKPPDKVRGVEVFDILWINRYRLCILYDAAHSMPRCIKSILFQPQ